MVAIVSAIAACVWASLWLLPWQPHRTRERFMTGGPAPGADLSGLSVLIPARNEADTLPATLAALARQGPGLQVLVIDDESTDRTAAIVESLARAHAVAGAAGTFAVEIRLLRGRPLPEGWGGKLWALQQGLDRAERRQLLLLDADIALDDAVVPALLAATKERGVALLSVMATLRTENFWERLLVPPFIFFFKLLYPFACANDGNSRVAAAAGGLILIDAAALRGEGGLEPIRDALIDDCALAGVVKRAGHPTWIGLSHAVRSTRAYTSLGDFWRMVSRTAFTQLKYSTALLVIATLAMLALFVVPLAALALGAGTAWLGFAAWLAMAAAYAPIVAFYRLPLLWTLSLPFAAVLFLAMTWDSAIAYWRGTRARWKDRAYQSPES